MIHYRLMTTSKIQNILNNHSIESRIEEGRVLALAVYTFAGRTFEKWVDLTNHTMPELKFWLGY